MNAASLRCLLVVLVATTVGVAHPASACSTSESQQALIHSALPPILPIGAVVLDVKIDTSNSARLYRSGLPARVLSVRHGEVQSTTVVLRTPIGTSCDAPFANGSTGIIVGFWTGEGDDRALSPVFVTRGDGFRLGGDDPVQPRGVRRWRASPLFL